MGLICLVLWFSVQVCQAATCSADLTYQECQDNNCQVVMGSRCNSNGAYVPPCDLNFNNQFTEECCDPTVASDEHVHYLGCMSPGFVCMIQCMEYVPTGDIYIVWEGCGFTGGDWRDASGEHQCDTCFDDTCGEGEGWFYWVLLIAICMLALAALIVLGSLLFFGGYWIYQYYLYQKGSVYSPMVASYPPAEELREMSAPPRRAQGQNVVPVIRREDGMIVIAMADGSNRVVTPQMYQKLYHQQQVKRAQIMQQRRIQQQQKRRQDNQDAQSSAPASPETSEVAEESTPTRASASD